MKTPTEVAAAMLAAVAATDLRPLLATIDLPTLLVNGRQSVVPWEVGKWLADELPRARSVVLEAGHGPFWDDPVRFNEAIRSFIASLDDTPAT
jgi:non-heme chloroperoxidase